MSTVLPSIFGQTKQEEEVKNQDFVWITEMGSRNNSTAIDGGGTTVAGLPPPARMDGKQQQKDFPVGGNNKNRRALGDIGNVVVKPPRQSAADGKQPVQISRPITRSFGAQLLRKANEAAKNVQKPVRTDAVGSDAVVGPKGGGAKARPKPAVPNCSKSKEVIEISPDTKSKPRKKVASLTSVLTARSKTACGITGRPKEIAHDIDGKDAGDQLAMLEYVEDIYKYYRMTENGCRPNDYMESQTEINGKMRSILADWMIEVHHRFELSPETLYLTFYIIDKYLSMEVVLRREFQLLGVSSMLIACKYEEIWAPEVNDFICISDRAYTRQQILAMEKHILEKLEWNLTVPTPYVFLSRFLKASFPDKEIEHMVFFFAELGLLQYGVTISYTPSKFAASAVYAARYTLKKTPLWTDALQFHTGFKEEELKECVNLLVNAHLTAPESKLKVVFKKYSSPVRGSVALLAPAEVLPSSS